MITLCFKRKTTYICNLMVDTSSQNYLLDCLARKVNSMTRTEQKSFGEKLRKHHTEEWIDNLKERMKAVK